ncbi:MAG: hypothetical protein JNL78_02955 [Rhodocyclaceae bacterium]|jgi:hypothetical protein|nr:hypothetical protein [Rhodocyclaceae bacterium]
MRLDLTGAVRLRREHAVQLDAIAAELRRPYVEFVSGLGAPFGADLDWWVTPLASRNTYVCPLFRRLCQVVLAQRLAVAGGVSEIVVDTPAMAGLLREAVPSSVQVLSVLTQLRWRLRAALAILRRLAATLYACGGRYVFSRLIPPAGRALPAEPITLVDTFLYPESIQAGAFNDRHYPGLMQQLGEDERRRVYWAPVFYRLRNHVRQFRRLRACRDNLLLAEDYLRLGDYAYAIGHFLRGRRMLPEREFLGMRIGRLLREAYADAYAGSGSIEGLLRYRFARRLNEAGVRLQRVVEWFENQEIDHGAVSGWLTFFPDTKVIGYQGFLASRNYLCMFPLETERALGLLPQTIGVMGSALADPAREFCAGLDVRTAPAFRFDALWRLPEGRPRHDGATLLVSLPLEIGETRQIIEMVGLALGNEAVFREWRVWVKPHPAFPRRLLEAGDRMGREPGWTLVEGDLDDLLEVADCLVGSASSACVQAVVHGVPAAVVGGRARPTLNPIPEWVDGELWAVCHAAEDLRAALARQARDVDARARLRAVGATVRERLFRPVTPMAVRELLGLPRRAAETAA